MPRCEPPGGGRTHRGNLPEHAGRSWCGLPATRRDASFQGKWLGFCENHWKFGPQTAQRCYFPRKLRRWGGSQKVLMADPPSQ
jgi:hypothetical protein